MRSLRVADQDGAPCCVLTLVGLRTMRPGSAGIVSFDFSEDVVLGGGDGDGPLLPCYRVSATLGAEEVAYDATSSASRRIRALTLSEDSADVEPGCTDSVSLTVRLPLDAPVTLSTDLVGVRTECRIEMLVRRPEMASEDVLALEVPCRVVGDGVEEEERVELEGGVSRGRRAGRRRWIAVEGTVRLTRGTGRSQDAVAPHGGGTVSAASEEKVFLLRKSLNYRYTTYSYCYYQ